MQRIPLVCTFVAVIALLAMAVVSMPRLGSALLAQVSPSVSSRQAVIGGQTVGEVIVNNQVVFRIRTSAGGLSPVQRADIVAERLQLLIADNLGPEDITTGRRNGMNVVLARDEVVITADPAHAAINQTEPTALADMWAQRLQNTLAGQPVEQAPRVAERVVPIISVGTGVRIGGAVVTGESAQLAQVVAVAQIEGQFGDAVRVRALVPVSSEDVVRDIRRIPGTSVIGLADIRL